MNDACALVLNEHGQPEVLTPQPPPMMEPVPNGNGTMPPSSSGYIPIPRSGLIDHGRLLLDSELLIGAFQERVSALLGPTL